MSLDHYYEALERMISGTPRIVSKSSNINKDQVAIEAGRKRGSIKKSRPTHEKLINAIQVARDEYSKSNSKAKRTLNRQKDLTDSYKDKYHSVLNREVMYLNKIASLEK